jgi:replicative DNA helicase
MLARMLYAVPESNVGNRSLIPRPIRAEVKQAYVDVIERMLDWQPEEPIVLSLDPDAYTEWKDFQRSVESDMRDGGRPVLCPRLG